MDHNGHTEIPTAAVDQRVRKETSYASTTLEEFIADFRVSGYLSPSILLFSAPLTSTPCWRLQPICQCPPSALQPIFIHHSKPAHDACRVSRNYRFVSNTWLFEGMQTISVYIRTCLMLFIVGLHPYIKGSINYKNATPPSKRKDRKATVDNLCPILPT